MRSVARRGGSPESDSSLSKSDLSLSSLEDDQRDSYVQGKDSRGSSQRRSMSPPETQTRRNRRPTRSQSRSSTPFTRSDDPMEGRRIPSHYFGSENFSRKDVVQGTTKTKARDKSKSRSVSPRETPKGPNRGPSNSNNRSPSPTFSSEDRHLQGLAKRKSRDKSRSQSVSPQANKRRSHIGLLHNNYRSPSPYSSSEEDHTEDGDVRGSLQNKSRGRSRSRYISQHASPTRVKRRQSQSKSRSPSSKNESPRRSSSESSRRSFVPSRTPAPMRWEGPHPSDIKLEPGLGPSTNWGRTPLGSRSPSMTLDPVEESIAVEESMKCYAKEREASLEKKERHDEDEIDVDDFDDFDGDEEDDDDEGYGLSAENTLKQEFYLIIKEIKEKKFRVRGPPIVKSPLPLTKQKVQKVWSG